MKLWPWLEKLNRRLQSGQTHITCRQTVHGDIKDEANVASASSFTTTLGL
jgi:hypothetical protein